MSEFQRDCDIQGKQRLPDSCRPVPFVIVNIIVTVIQPDTESTSHCRANDIPGLLVTISLSSNVDIGKLDMSKLEATRTWSINSPASSV